MPEILAVMGSGGMVGKSLVSGVITNLLARSALNCALIQKSAHSVSALAAVRRTGTFVKQRNSGQPGESESLCKPFGPHADRFIIPAGAECAKDYGAASDELTQRLAEKDIVVLDEADTLLGGSRHALRLATHVAIVTVPEHVLHTDLLRFVDELDATGSLSRLSVIVNMARFPEAAEIACSRLEHDLRHGLGIAGADTDFIPYDEGLRSVSDADRVAAMQGILPVTRHCLTRISGKIARSCAVSTWKDRVSHLIVELLNGPGQADTGAVRSACRPEDANEVVCGQPCLSNAEHDIGDLVHFDSPC
jgi:hypothetical protein